jgi:hypothetical protein
LNCFSLISKTDKVFEEIASGDGMNEFSPNDLRLVLRMSALFHDVGKLIDVYTPGYHPDLGKKLWNKYDSGFSCVLFIYLCIYLFIYLFSRQLFMYFIIILFIILRDIDV